MAVSRLASIPGERSSSAPSPTSTRAPPPASTPGTSLTPSSALPTPRSCSPPSTDSQARARTPPLPRCGHCSKPRGSGTLPACCPRDGSTAIRRPGAQAPRDQGPETVFAISAQWGTHRPAATEDAPRDNPPSLGCGSGGVERARARGVSRHHLFAIVRRGVLCDGWGKLEPNPRSRSENVGARVPPAGGRRGSARPGRWRAQAQACVVPASYSSTSHRRLIAASSPAWILLATGGRRPPSRKRVSKVQANTHHTRTKRRAAIAVAAVASAVTVVVVAVGLGSGAVSSHAASTAGPNDPCEPWGNGKKVAIATAKLIVEYNATDEDIGVHGAFDDQGWSKLCVYDPNGHLVLRVSPQSQLKDLTMAGIFFESREPPHRRVLLRGSEGQVPRGPVQRSRPQLRRQATRRAARRSRTTFRRPRPCPRRWTAPRSIPTT